MGTPPLTLPSDAHHSIARGTERLIGVEPTFEMQISPYGAGGAMPFVVISDPAFVG